MSSAVAKDGNTVRYILAATIVAAAFLVKDHHQTPYDYIFNEEGPPKGVEPALLQAITRVESSFNPNAYAKEPSGHSSYGLMQILDTTANSFGISNYVNLYDPRLNVQTGVKLLESLRLELGSMFSLDTWIAAYNAGAPAIKRRGVFNFDYVSKVKQHYYLYKIGANV